MSSDRRPVWDCGEVVLEAMKRIHAHAGVELTMNNAVYFAGDPVSPVIGADAMAGRRARAEYPPFTDGPSRAPRPRCRIPKPRANIYRYMNRLGSAGVTW
jgi:hypothetical protein